MNCSSLKCRPYSSVFCCLLLVPSGIRLYLYNNRLRCCCLTCRGDLSFWLIEKRIWETSFQTRNLQCCIVFFFPCGWTHTTGERRGPEPGREVGPPDSSVTATSKTWGTSVQCPTAAYLQLPALCMYSTAAPSLSTHSIYTWHESCTQPDARK